MADLEEGTSFKGAFLGLFGSNTEEIDQRLTRERNAGLTPRQREARNRKKDDQRSIQVNMRAKPSTKALLDSLAAHLSNEKGTKISAADVFEMAVIALAAANKIEIDK